MSVKKYADANGLTEFWAKVKLYQQSLVNKTCPVGKVDIYAGSTAPTGWLLCQGQAISRTTYADLFAVIGTTYGEGDGSTTFNVPNLCDRVPIGAGNTYSLNSSGGSTTHTHTTGDHTLSLEQSPSHNHGSAGNDGWADFRRCTGGSNLIIAKGGTGIGRTDGSTGATFSLGSAANQTITSRLTVNSVHTHSSNGGGAAHNHGDTGSSSNMMPYRGINFIIYYGTTV